MPEDFSGLTPAKRERLIMLAEEAGEVVQAVTKILRHGYSSKHPNGGPTNAKTLERELGDLFAITDQMIARCDIDGAMIGEHWKEKWERARLYTHHQKGE